MDPISITALVLAGLGGLFGGGASIYSTVEQSKAAAEQLKQAKDEFNAQQQQVAQQEAKENATQSANAGALEDVFNKKKKKTSGDMFLSDIPGLT